MISSHIPLRIAVTGVTGRMGKNIIQCIMQTQKQQFNRKIILGAAIARSQSSVCGMDIGVFMQSDHTTGIIITDNIDLVKEDFDVLIDFTTPEATIEYLKFCVINRKNIIIGSTGFDQTHLRFIKNLSQKIGIVYSANFSIGIAVMLKVLKEVTRIIGNSTNIDIIEAHHNRKKDIPSGTALMIRNIIENNKIKINNLFKDIEYFYINKKNKAKDILSLISDQDIMIHSIRSGDIVGEHTVLFSSIGERLEITHKASSRTIFVNGALRAAIWLGKTKTGLFDLNDVLELNI